MSYAFPPIRPLDPNILVIHGYEIHRGGRLGPLAQAVCTSALPILRNDPLKRVVLLGGWHLKEAGSSITIADAMKRWLFDQGLHNPTRIITQRDFPSLAEYMPARDAWEETVLLRAIFNDLLISFEQPFHTVAWDFHIPRLTNIYRTYHLMRNTSQAVIPKTHTGLRHRRRMEWAARVLSIIDPTGTGILCHETRVRRTLEEGKKPLIP